MAGSLGDLLLELISSLVLTFFLTLQISLSCVWPSLHWSQYPSLIMEERHWWMGSLRPGSRQSFFHSQVTVFLNIDNLLWCQPLWFLLMAPWLCSLLLLPVVFSCYILPGARISVIHNLSCASSLDGFPATSRPEEGSDMESSLGVALKGLWE